MQFLITGFNHDNYCICLEPGTSFGQLQSNLALLSGIPPDQQRLTFGTKELNQDSFGQVPACQEFVSLQLNLRLVGGKGGFGSLLRGGPAGVAFKRTTNFGACRDLNGRRLKHVETQRKLNQWIEQQKKLEQERRQQKKEQTEKKPMPLAQQQLQKIDQERRNISTYTTASVSKGLEIAKSIKEKESNKKRKREETSSAVNPPSKKHCLWTEYDDMDSSDSEEDNHNSKESDENVQESEESDKSDKDDSQSEFTTTTITTTTITTTSDPTNGNLPTQESLQKEKSKPIDLQAFSSALELEQLGTNTLKDELLRLGMKCGGTMQQRAERLFSVKGIAQDQIPAKLLAKPPRNLKRKRISRS